MVEKVQTSSFFFETMFFFLVGVEGNCTSEWKVTFDCCIWYTGNFFYFVLVAEVERRKVWVIGYLFGTVDVFCNVSE